VKGPLDIHRDLLAAGVPHEIVRLPRSIAGADELPDVLELPAGSCVSVRMYDADGELYALAVPASAPTRPTTLARALGVPAIRPAAVDDVNVLTDSAQPWSRRSACRQRSTWSSTRRSGRRTSCTRRRATRGPS
jgi:hypothetical protein